MRYEDLIASISEIVENEKIFKRGLTLVYTLNDQSHVQINQVLFYKSNPPTATFQPNDELEIDIDGIIVKIIKEKTNKNE